MADAVAAPAGWNTLRNTVAESVEITGHGLHTGDSATVRFSPLTGRKDGTVFRLMRTGEEIARIPAALGRWRNFPLCSTLVGENDFRIQTVEHLMAALVMSEVDQVAIDIEGGEIPILDGGALAWMELLRSAGRTPVNVPKRFIRVKRPFTHAYGDTATYKLEPCDPATPAYAVDLTVHETGAGNRSWNVVLTPEMFMREIAPARTYGNPCWAVPAMVWGLVSGKRMLRGLRAGCCAGVIAGHVIGGMRVPDEWLRHRLLDMVGDFGLAGGPVIGQFTVDQPSHRRNVAFMRRFLRNKDAWEWATFPHGG